MDVTRRKDLMASHQAGGGAVDLNTRGERYGPKAADINSKFIESPTGWSIADATRKIYSGDSARRPSNRGINGIGPYMLRDPPLGMRAKKTAGYPIYLDR